MTDKDKVTQMEDLNWKPAAQYWKGKAEEAEEKFKQAKTLYLETLDRVVEAEKKLNEAMVALEKVQAFVKDIEPYADQGHTLVPSLQYACEVYNKLKGKY